MKRLHALFFLTFIVIIPVFCAQEAIVVKRRKKYQKIETNPFLGLDDRIITFDESPQLKKQLNERFRLTIYALEGCMLDKTYADRCKTPLFAALSLATPDAYRWLKGYLPTNEHERKCASKLFLKAIKSHKQRAMRIFVEDIGIDINVNPQDLRECCEIDDLGSCAHALIFSVRNSDVWSVTFLLEHGANPNVVTSFKCRTSLMIALRAYLTAKGKRNFPSEKAKCGKFKQIITLLMSNSKIDLNQQDRDGKDIYFFIHPDSTDLVCQSILATRSKEITAVTEEEVVEKIIV